MKKKVMLVGPNRNIVGGVATHINILTEALEKVGINTDIYELKDYSNKNKLVKKLSDIMKILKIRKSSSNGYLAVHLNPSIYYGSFLKLILTLFFLKHNNIVVQFHGGSFDNLSKLNNSLLKTGVVRILKKAKCFLFLSTDQKEAFLSKFPDLEDFSFIVPNFINTETNFIQKDNKKLSILFLARLVEEKGVLDLINATTKIDEADIEVKIIGEGECKEKILCLIKENQLESKIKFLGAKFGKEKEKHLQEADIYILPSNWKEGIPYTVLEAMKYRAMVLCTPQGGLKDIIIDGYNGIFIEKDAESIARTVKKLISNKPLINTINENAYQYLEKNLSINKAGITFKNIYLRETQY
ncbi:glycosyltransferase family 4 protein [Priestia megaterium]|uniref:glycosyltransferase family 4 protein n=1 Tax=Priestia megaterium TaxID=1404 RepID=UPI001884A3C5|nr:glycosyltransferase family 4 protein [Priestia megaterium]